MTQEATADQLDAAILEVLREAPGETMAWARLRNKLPDPRYWPRLRALTRLVETGAVDVSKDDRGRNYVALAPIVPPRVRCGVA